MKAAAGSAGCAGGRSEATQADYAVHVTADHSPERPGGPSDASPAPTGRNAGVTDSTADLFDERLYVPWWWWLAAVVLTGVSTQLVLVGVAEGTFGWLFVGTAVFVVAGDVPVVAGLLYGLKAAVLAVVVQALIKVSGRALGSAAMIVIAIAAFVGIALLRLPFPLIIALAALTGAVLHMAAPHLLPAAKGSDEAHASSITVRGQDHGAVARTTVLWLAIWLVPLAALLVLLGRGDVFADAALFFSQTAIVTFGGAYAVLAYVAQQAVENYHWLTAKEMLDGLGMAETTPGPLIMVTQFVGFMAAFRQPGVLPALVAGTLGGLLTTWVTFLPCFLWIFLGAPHVERLRGNRALAGALAAVTAAVVGVILNLSLWFALHTLFAQTRAFSAGPLRLDVPVLASLDPFAAALSVAALAAVFGLRLGILPVLAGCAVAGLLLRLSGLV